MPEEHKAVGEAIQAEETDAKIMAELKDMVDEAREQSSLLYSVSMKLYGLIEMFIAEYGSGKNVDHFGAWIHNAFADFDNARAGVIDDETGETGDILENLLACLWGLLEEHEVLHPKDSEGDKGTGDRIGDGSPEPNPIEDEQV